MADVFEEVEEQLRSDRYRSLALKLLPWLGGLLAIALAVAGGYEFYDYSRTQAAAKASDEYNQAMEAYAQGRTSEAQTLWTEVSKSPAKAYKALSLQHLAGLRLADGKTAEGVQLLDQAAAAAPDILLADAARLKAAFALLDTASLADMHTRLDPLTKEGRPYRTEAQEALAFAKLMAGDTAGARGDFVVISLSPDAQDSARNRARAAMALIDSGSAKVVPAAVKAALALPKPPPEPVGSAAPMIPGLNAPAEPQDQTAQ